MIQWIQVIPQIMARIDIPVSEIRNLLNELLIKISREHPQALIYQVTVSCKSKSMPRKEAALKVLKDMSTFNPIMVSQSVKISEELIRTAILLVEMWKEGIEEAWK